MCSVYHSYRPGLVHRLREFNRSYFLLFSFALEPLLPKKLHTKSQDKLDRDEPERERKEKKKEKRNSKHQEIFDKELKTMEIPLQPTEAVILSETVLKTRPRLCSFTCSKSTSSLSVVIFSVEPLYETFFVYMQNTKFAYIL